MLNDYESRRDMAMRRRSMRDMARREREMRDGRNPYGSRGGYITNRDPRRRDRGMEDMTHGMDYNYGDMRGYDRNYEDMARGGRDYGYPFEVRGEFDMARRRNSRGQYMSDGHYPMMPYMDYGYGDYASGEKLSQEELEDWHEDLCEQIPEQYRHLYKKEEIEKIARQMQIEFDKFSPLELTVTATMLASDYYESVSPSDIQRYVSMAKQFLCDKDSKLKYGAKLSAYYDSVVNG